MSSITNNSDQVFDEILGRFQANGHRHYGENVTEQEHALQSAAAAERLNASDEVIVACLLHDYGHLLHELGETIADAGIDARHEDLGAAMLREKFPDSIVEPVRMHVDAKRYLCTIDPQYLSTLSPASVQSFQLQGGRMTDEEVRTFEDNPHFQSAILLRRCDDAAKVVGAPTKSLEDYRELVKQFVIA